MAGGPDIIAPDVVRAAEYIASAWRQGIEHIIETGRRLIEVRDRLDDQSGMWSRLIGDNQWSGQGLLPFGARHVYRLINIAEDSRLLTHVSVLPSDTYTLFQLTRLSDGRFAALLAAGRIHPGMKRNEAAAETREERQAEDEARVLRLRPRRGRFKTLVIDPPWDYEWLSLAGRAAPGYATMTHAELLSFDVSRWADERSHAYCWTTNNFLTRAVELMEAWGFAHKTVLTWIKPHIGLGSYFRNSTEHILFGVRGELGTRKAAESIPTHFAAPLGDHSEKPERFYEIVRAASYPPYGEVFQRAPRPDFTNVFMLEKAA